MHTWQVEVAFLVLPSCHRCCSWPPLLVWMTSSSHRSGEGAARGTSSAVVLHRRPEGGSPSPRGGKDGPPVTGRAGCHTCHVGAFRISGTLQTRPAAGLAGRTFPRRPKTARGRSQGGQGQAWDRRYPGRAERAVLRDRWTGRAGPEARKLRGHWAGQQGAASPADTLSQVPRQDDRRGTGSGGCGPLLRRPKLGAPLGGQLPPTQRRDGGTLGAEWTLFCLRPRDVGVVTETHLQPGRPRGPGRGGEGPTSVAGLGPSWTVPSPESTPARWTGSQPSLTCSLGAGGRSWPRPTHRQGVGAPDRQTGGGQAGPVRGRPQPGSGHLRPVRQPRKPAARQRGEAEGRPLGQSPVETALCVSLPGSHLQHLLS